VAVPWSEPDSAISKASTRIKAAGHRLCSAGRFTRSGSLKATVWRRSARACGRRGPYPAVLGPAGAEPEHNSISTDSVSLYTRLASRTARRRRPGRRAASGDPARARRSSHATFGAAPLTRGAALAVHEPVEDGQHRLAAAPFTPAPAEGRRQQKHNEVDGHGHGNTGRTRPRDTGGSA
jgi:hypothetical protein